MKIISICFLLWYFSCWVDLFVFYLMLAKLCLWCFKGCVPVLFVKTSMVATHYAEFKRIGACAPAQAIPTTQ